MDNREAAGRLVALFRGYRGRLAAILVCLLASTALNLCVPLMSRSIMDDGFIGGDYVLLVRLVLCVLLAYVVIAALDLAKERIRVGIAAGIQYSLARQAFRHLMRLRASYFEDTNCAEILSNLNADVANMASVADSGAFFVVTQAFGMSGGLVGLFILDWRMALLVLAFIPAKYVVMRRFARRRKAVMDGYIAESQRYAGWFGDTVGGAREARLFGVVDARQGEFDELQRGIIGKQKRMNMLAQWNQTADSVLVQLLAALVYVVGANLVFSLQLSVGSVFAFVTYSAYVTGPISAILNIGYLLSGILPSTRRYYAFMDLEEEADGGTGTRPDFGDLCLRGVSFAYAEGKTVLSDVSIDFPKGSKTALVGRNGAGKTTVIELLTRMYEPDAGQILLDGRSISDFTLEAYRGMVSVVSQQTYLFEGTVRSNICLGREASDAELLDICEDSGLGDFVREATLDCEVGQNGTMLSGGQRQKIALARALLLDRPIVILDEATSGADSYSEQQIDGLLQTRLKDKTVIVVTHRTGILDLVDQVVLVEDGRVRRLGHDHSDMR